MAHDLKKQKNAKDKNAVIIEALREAVLEHIGDTKVQKKVIKKIEEDQLSVSLQKIGKKLARKNLTSKKMRTAQKASLTKIEIEELTRAVGTPYEKKKKLTSNKKPSLKKEALRPPRAFEKDVLSQPISLRKDSPKPALEKNLKEYSRPIARDPIPQMVSTKQPITDAAHLLRKPTLSERVRGSRSLKILLFTFLFTVPIAGLLIGSVVYAYSTDGNGATVQIIARSLRLPALKVNTQTVLLADYKNDVVSLSKFFKAEAENIGEDSPPESEIRENIINRYVTILLIREALNEFGQTVTEEEVNAQLEAIIGAYQNASELNDIIRNLYGWTLDDFIVKAFLPILEEERLAVIIGTNESLNDVKKRRLVEIKQQIDGGGSFEEIAKLFSEDVSASEGGDLGWFSKGQMVPEFENVAFTIEQGVVSEPFQTAFGWHILEVTDKDEEDETVRARHILIRNTSVEEFLEERRRSSDIRYYVD